MPDDVENIRNVVQIGQDNYKEFVEMRITIHSEGFIGTLLFSELKLLKQEKSNSAVKSSEVRKMKEEQQVATSIHKAIHAGQNVLVLIKLLYQFFVLKAKINQNKSSGFGQLFHDSTSRNWNLLKHEVPAGSNQPEPRSGAPLPSCNQEKAGSRILLNLAVVS